MVLLQTLIELLTLAGVIGLYFKSTIVVTIAKNLPLTPSVPPVMGPSAIAENHVVCSKCTKVVARYGLAEDGSIQCANCLAGNL
jgi:hypothetical protein